MEKIIITKYEQSCFTLSINDTENYVFDPGSEASIDVILQKPATAVFVSHSHPDHFDINNLKKLNCKTYGAKEVVDGLAAEGLTAVELKPNEVLAIGNLAIKPFLVDHGPISAPIVNLGFYITINTDKSILFLGDIAIPSKLPFRKFDLLLIPVGGGKVFDTNQSLGFVKSLNYKGRVTPVHYHGRADRSSGDQFKHIASAYCDVKVLTVGESLMI